MKGKLVFRIIIGSCILSIVGIISLYILYPRPYREIVEETSREYQLDSLFVYAMMRTESKFDTHAISRSGAKGLMQIMDGTGKWGAEICKIENYTTQQLFEPKTNIQIGIWYISKLIKQYEGDQNLALIAYNAGSGNVAKWRKNTAYSKDGKNLHSIPFKETENYLKKVNRNYKIYKVLYDNQGGNTK